MVTSFILVFLFRDLGLKFTLCFTNYKIISNIMPASMSNQGFFLLHLYKKRL